MSSNDLSFTNPANGHTEVVSQMSMLWALLFGPLYYLLCGLWAPCALFALVAGGIWSAMGPPGTLLVMPVWVAFALLTVSLRRKSYLRRGWIPSGARETAGSVEGDTRQCPFCAEQIKVQALKCKHCGSDVSATAPAGHVPRVLS